MLVKFKLFHIVDPILLDSNRIFAIGNQIFSYDNLRDDTCLEVDDKTLAYLQNAWAHEGMRRVKIIYGDEKDGYDSKFGWYLDGKIFTEHPTEDLYFGILGELKNVIAFIPYENGLLTT